MSNVHFNFMPNTVNQVIKLFSATRRQTKPVDDHFLVNEEYDSTAKTGGHMTTESDASSVMSFASPERILADPDSLLKVT